MDHLSCGRPLQGRTRQPVVVTCADAFAPNWWRADGVRGRNVFKDLESREATASNELVVGQTLQITRDEYVFAIGDCAHLVAGSWYDQFDRDGRSLVVLGYSPGGA